MPDPTMSDALREAYASAPAADVIYDTLEIWHPVFAVPIRVVCDYAPLDARLEAGAARDPGAVVTFSDYPFEVIVPEQTSESVPQAMITIDNVDRQILAQLDQAVTDSRTTTVIWRRFISGRELLGPENDPPLELTITSVSATATTITATAGFPNLLQRKFPGGEYTIDRFPGLQP